MIAYKTLQLFYKLALLLLLSVMTGCASVPGGPTEGDPFESYNRAMFSFNEALDDNILYPIADGYDRVMPGPVKTGVSNFFNNIDDLFVIINDILQFKFKQALQDTSRVFFNSTIGLFGLIDVATPMGMPKHNEDFGQTLAVWGVGKGPYVILPFFGSRTLRGVGGFALESYYDPVYTIQDVPSLYGTVTVRVIDDRYHLLKAGRIVDKAALDKYSFIRDAYLQNRLNLIYDGNPPHQDEPLPESNEEDLQLENELELELDKSLR